jgi:hypothetical protein
MVNLHDEYLLDIQINLKLYEEQISFLESTLYYTIFVYDVLLIDNCRLYR